MNNQKSDDSTPFVGETKVVLVQIESRISDKAANHINCIAAIQSMHTPTYRSLLHGGSFLFATGNPRSVCGVCAQVQHGAHTQRHSLHVVPVAV